MHAEQLRNGDVIFDNLDKQIFHFFLLNNVIKVSKSLTKSFFFLVSDQDWAWYKVHTPVMFTIILGTNFFFFIVSFSCDVLSKMTLSGQESKRKLMARGSSVISFFFFDPLPYIVILSSTEKTKKEIVFLFLAFRVIQENQISFWFLFFFYWSRSQVVKINKVFYLHFISLQMQLCGLSLNWNGRVMQYSFLPTAT